MKNRNYWKHEKEFDTKTLIENTDTHPTVEKKDSKLNVTELVQISKEKSEQIFSNSHENDSKSTKNVSDFKEISSFREYINSNETKVYEPRPLTPEDDIYEDVMEQFASAPTKPKYWFEELGDYWSCSCGHINKGDKCKNCGLERELLRSLFILHKPAGEPGKLNKKLKKSKEQIDREEERHEAIEKQRKKCNETRGDSLTIVPIEEDPSSTRISPDESDNPPQNSVPESSPQKEEHENENTQKKNTDEIKSEKAEENTDKTKNNENTSFNSASPKKESRFKSISFRAKLISIIIILLLLATAGGIGVYKYLAAPAMQYDEAMKLQASGKYEKAIAKYESLGDYRDSQNQIWKCYISWGDQQYSEGQYNKAISTYNIAMNLKASDKIQKKIRKCHIGIGDDYYDNNEFEKALSSYATAMEMEESDQLQEKINKAKFAYINAYKSKRTKQVEQYISDLMALKYAGIQEIYDEYYAWHVKLIANTSESDLSTDVDTVNLSDTIYFHASLSGGEPSEEIELYYEVTWPNGSTQIYNLNSKWKTGSNITARFQYPIPLFGTEGKMSFKLYNKSNNEAMGSDSVTFKN